MGRTLLALIAGFKFRAGAGLSARLGVGGATGALGGATGLMGSIVILFNLSSGDDTARSRANTAIFLTLISLLVMPQMAAQSILFGAALALGALMHPLCAGHLGRAAHV